MKLKEVCEVFSGYAFKDFHNDEVGFPVIKIGNIKSDGSIDLINCSFTSENPSTRFISKSGDVYIALSGATTGKIGLMTKDGYYINQRVGIVRLNNSNIPVHYLKYFLNSKTAKILSDAAGAAQPNISPKDIEKYDFLEKSTDEMIKIANELDSINNEISEKQKRLLDYDEVIKSRFNEMFVDKGFGIKPIRYFINKDKISAKKMYSESDYINYVDISSIDNSKNQIVSSTKYVFKDAPSRAQQCLKKKDILVSTVRPNLKNIAMFDLSNEGYVGSSGFCVLRPVKCNPHYLKFVVLTDDFTDKMISLTTGASYPAIRDNDVFEYQMIDSPIDLQNEFGEFVEMIDKSKFVVQQQIKDLKELLDKKMDEYFGG